jgi:RHH-type proline utilization regulon transcriptional repressor/proline dehydrogenase/delta 1-pyrroline-5-carboxylate dehydrogenase
MAYLVRRLLENTSNESFVRHELLEGDAAEALLRPPSPPIQAMTEVETMTGRKALAETVPFRNEPLRDFSRKDVRDAFARALLRVEEALGAECPVVIDGVPLSTRERLNVTSPSDGMRLVAVSAVGEVEHADRAVAAASAGATAWRAVPAHERAAILERAADLLVARRDELAAWTCFEAGKPWRDADADVAEAADFCRYYARGARVLAVGESTSVPGEANQTVYAARGPTAVIAPWNFPVAIIAGMVASASASATRSS